MPQSLLEVSPISYTVPIRPDSYPREDCVKETALHHAQIIQQRKDIEALTLVSIESLLDLPSSPSADAGRPSLADSTVVKHCLRPFQPSDFDALIEERNINQQCGYVLCPRLKQSQDTQSKYRILRGEGKGRDALKFVETHTLERWCSNDCRKRALYIKLQLSEEPAWIRAHSIDESIVLLKDESTEEVREAGGTGITERLKSFGLNADEQDSLEKLVPQANGLSP